LRYCGRFYFSLRVLLGTAITQLVARSDC
jgi:hypothetical protein